MLSRQHRSCGVHGRANTLFKISFALQDFKLAKGITTYPVTLLWYPKMQDPDSFTIGSDAYAFGDASLLPFRGSSPTFTELSPLPEPLELITATGQKQGKGTPISVRFQRLFLGLKGRLLECPRRLTLAPEWPCAYYMSICQDIATSCIYHEACRLA